MSHKSDTRGVIFYKLRYIRLLIYSTFSSIFVKISLILRGVECGIGTKFYGIAVTIRSKNSKIKIGEKCSFRSDFSSNLVGINRRCIVSTIREDATISIGDNSGFSGTVIAAAKSIKIGNNVLCGANTTITDFDWHGLEPDKRNQPADPKSIVIEDNVWLGLNVVVLKGVTIGENTVIGANSLVTKDIPANVIAAGNPCKVIREL